MKKVLWIEDQANFDYQELKSAVILSGKFQMTIAENGSEAIMFLKNQEFDIIIVDLRIPPGNEVNFTKIFVNLDYDMKSARIGLLLLQRIFNKKHEYFLSDLKPYAYESKRYGIFTIENESTIDKEMNLLGIKNYFHKNGFISRDSLLAFIKHIENHLQDD